MLLICPNTTLLRSDNPRLRGFHFLCLPGFKAQGVQEAKTKQLGMVFTRVYDAFLRKKVKIVSKKITNLYKLKKVNSL